MKLKTNNNKLNIATGLIAGSAICAAAFISGGCSTASAQPGDFEYREIYLPDPNNEDAKSLGLNNIDNDWAIWGHHLSNVLPAKNPSETVFATINGETEYEQFCFSSDQLHQYIIDYIDDNYGHEDTKRFAILPNDNDIVCQCEVCVAQGNTKTNASPAVFNLIKKLAAKYPKHQFFTSYYLTTKDVPAERLPENVGVLLSAMDYPLSTKPTVEEQAFKSLIDSWASKTDKVYVWDYINNFDDYFTPYPILGVMDRRLDLYRNSGVAGVFLNGSGTDYSTFSDIKKKVMAEMLKETDTDWKAKVREVSKAYYPETGNIIADYIISQEDYVAANGVRLPMYEGIDAITKTYLDETAFVDFYHKLEEKAPSLSGQEKADVEKMLAAMSFTRLELYRKNGDVAKADKHIRRLNSLLPDIGVYNEGCWPIETYIRDYNYLMTHNETSGGESLIKGKALIPHTPLDPDYSDISIVTDGVLGIPSNYHSGNMISSANPALVLEVPQTEGLGGLRIWCVRNKAYKIDLPESISLSVGGQNLGTVVPPAPEHNSGHSIVEFDIPQGVSGQILLTIKKNPEVKTMAIDEIEAFR